MIQGVAAKWSFSSLSAIKEVKNDFLFFVYLTTKRVVYQGKSIYLHRISFISKGQ